MRRAFAAACLCLTVSTGLCGPAAAQDWSRRLATTSPAAAMNCRMAFDTVRNVAVCFGGWDLPLGSTVFQDTWQWDGVNWSLATPALVPSERCEHAMAFDLARGKVVMFSGQDFGFSLLDEILEFDGTNWVDVTPNTSRPTARVSAGLAYDVAGSRTILFGGHDNQLRNDTWAWDGAAWTQIATMNSPPPRADHGMAYDAARGRVVVFGGYNYSFMAPQFFADTWEFDGLDWAPAPTDNSPSARSGPAMVYDSLRGRTVLFGGGGLANLFDDLWEYDGTDWFRVTTATNPGVNQGMAAAFDSTRNVTVMFGGRDRYSARGETWEFGGAAPLYRTFGAGCAGTRGVPTLQPASLPAIGNTWRVDLGNLPLTAALASIVTGFSRTAWNGVPLPLNLGSFGMAGTCRSFVSADVAQLLAVNSGTAQFAINIPNLPIFAGLVLYQQGAVVDAGVTTSLQAVVTNAGEATLN